MVAPIELPVITLREAMAEKLRAALTRRNPAIRDLYDLDYAVRNLDLQLNDEDLITLVREKLAVPGNPSPEFGPERLAEFRGQVNQRLKPVLRDQDFAAFDLERISNQLLRMAARLASP